MNEQVPFDSQIAHRHFAVHCFNRAWELMEKTDRTADEDQEMVRLAHASHWHWTQVDGHTLQNISIALWQTARVYTLLGDARQARQSAEACVEISSKDGVDAFYLGYAFEALARAHAIENDRQAAAGYREKAARIAASVGDEDARRMLQRDLETIVRL